MDYLLHLPSSKLRYIRSTFSVFLLVHLVWNSSRICSNHQALTQNSEPCQPPFFPYPDNCLIYYTHSVKLPSWHFRSSCKHTSCFVHECLLAPHLSRSLPEWVCHHGFSKFEDVNVSLMEKLLLSWWLSPEIISWKKYGDPTFKSWEISLGELNTWFCYIV